jgi:hypothetical protein
MWIKIYINKIRVLSVHFSELYIFGYIYVVYTKEAETTLIAISVCLSVTAQKAFYAAFSLKTVAPIMLKLLSCVHCMYE